MFQRSGILLALAAALLLTVTSAEANAGERAFRHHHVVKRINIRNNIRVVDRSITVNVDRSRARHRLHRNGNTYSGDVVVSYRRGVGSWTYGSMTAPARSTIVQPSAKIIDIDKLGGGNHCQMEMGVCVIRN